MAVIAPSRLTARPRSHAVDVDFDGGEREQLFRARRRYREHGDRDGARDRLIGFVGLGMVHRDDTRSGKTPIELAGPRADFQSPARSPEMGHDGRSHHHLADTDRHQPSPAIDRRAARRHPRRSRKAVIATASPTYNL